ncbi:ATP-binding cassette sub- B member 5, partial [Lunasporangiospora selenospora]
QLKTGGTDIESPDTQQDQGLESKESHEQGHIIISETPLDERTTGRSSRQLNTFLRRGSATSHHTGKRSEKSVDFGEAEDPEAMFARQRWEEKRRLKQTKAPILRTMKYARDNLGVALIAAAFSVFQGTTFPLFSQIFSKALVALSTSSVNPNFTQETDRFSLYFLLLAFYSFLAFGIGTLTFMIIGERISRVMRHHSFKIILSQEMAFFDRPENSTGALASRLATDSQQMFDMVSVAVQTAVASTATVALGLGLAFAATWRMTLIVMAFMPVMGLAQYLELMALTGF